MKSDAWTLAQANAGMDWGFVMASAKYALEVGELSGCVPLTPKPDTPISNLIT